jgi:poly-gamma-glutamate capsule biosynthesis protein CapA/YwtB (metallophosphatase superfamily)
MGAGGDRLDRRGFLRVSAAATLSLMQAATHAAPMPPPGGKTLHNARPGRRAPAQVYKLFLCGDVMTGRGIDQVLPHPGDARIYEPYIRDARGYMQLAERANGPIGRPVDFAYIWGDALEVLGGAAPDARIINLETAVTRSDEYWPGKGINYRMHPDNIACLSAARIDCCVLANNHVLDWGYSGLAETLRSLHGAGLKTAGAGRNRQQAEVPAIIEVTGKGRVIVFAFGATSSGIPHAWAATGTRPGINLLADFSPATLRRIAAQVAVVKRPGDIAVASIHWGGNWGYAIPDEHRSFAHRLIDVAGIDVIHGHSSHHPKGIEVYRDKLIIYGCGDFVNDYEGIHGYDEFRGDLALLYLLEVDARSGHLAGLEMVPLQMRRFSLHHASDQDARWLADTLQREAAALNTGLKWRDDNVLVLGGPRQP